ncbi:hypothetical protein [Gloeothece verrucosa]|uniref:Glycosyltransferase RgtA/B/C/D-like domain-containing protein n=1 Tax=Gloeothece verrucosa (strain PCC 7822) TaxID=497965 RepID=E0UDF4_GLOV7|nr:hypothetical protein [Gloeothece verrucosa]ADN14145.1 conserved hypothetical protein [Gloeothece verrucosa PCC 7822]
MKTFRLKNISTPVILALSYFLLGALVTIIFGQDVNWDLRNYHFYNPYMLLTDRIKYDILPAQIQTFFNPLLDIPFFVSIYYLKIPSIIVNSFLGGLHGLNLWFVHYILYFSLINLKDTYKHLISLLAALTSFWGAAYLSELGTTMGDSTASLFALGSLLIIIYSLSKHQDIPLKNLMIAGLVMGLGVGLKLTVALYGISLIVAINFIHNNWPRKIRNLGIIIGTMFSGFMLTAGYWMFLMWSNFSNPLFPFFNKIFQSPYIETDFNLKDARFLPRNLLQAIFYPFYFLHNPNLVAELKFRDVRFSLAYILIVFLLGFALYKKFYNPQKTSKNPLINENAFRLFLPFFTAAYLIWLIQFSIYRYLIVLELLTPVLIVLVIGYIYPLPKITKHLSIALFFTLIITVQPLDWWRIAWSSNYFGIEKNLLNRYENSVIVMWGGEPMGYVVPYFPRHTRLVRITGNSGLSPNTLMRKNAEKIIKATPEKSLYLLEINFEKKEPDKQLAKQKDLAALGLTINPINCQPLSTHIEKYTICQLNKVN